MGNYMMMAKTLFILILAVAAANALPKSCKTDADCRGGGDSASYCKENGACRCSERFTWPGTSDHSTCLKTVWGFCKDKPPTGPIKNVELYVAPRVPDKNSTTITVEIFAQVSTPIVAGSISYEISHNGQPFMNNTDPLCDFVSGGCPVKEGQVHKTVDFAHWMPIIRKIDGGHYTGRAVFHTSGSEFACFELD